MAGAVAIDDSVSSTSGLGEEDRSVSGDSISEWRSCEQIDNGSPSTSPPFWDSDGEDDDPGPRPSDLFGRYTWKIENFSKEKKREMKSEPFEAGGYKWYILVYPQGCDVSNHLSLFLCVANHEKLLPGWSHFAQFTIAVGNIDPKKIKYSDTLHKFWKKEHDWGWKKFMELSKIQDGFLVDDVLEIIAQVQVIREKVDRPFRCLGRPYRRELLRVYMSNIEQIYRRVVEDRRSKLIKLIEDKMRWSSFRAFWLAIDPSTRCRMSSEKSDIILKILVKSFFVEKEVTSTLVMDALYTGLKALEHHSKDNKGTIKSTAVEELSTPMIHVDMDMFVLAGDFIAVLERAALEPLSCQPLSPKDDKCTQSRAKDGGSGEVNKVCIEHEERRLTEIGRKILEIYVLSHIFSGVEVAYQEAVALKRQEELIREEELLENEMKGKRNDKRAKKKQSKQKKNNRKVKDKEKEDISDSKFPEKGRDGNTDHSKEDYSKQAGELATKVDNFEECASDVSDNVNGSVEVCQSQTDTSDKNTVLVNAPNGAEIEPENTQTVNKDSSLEIESLVSSVTATVNSIRGKINNLLDSTGHVSPNRVRVRRKRVISKMNTVRDEDYLLSISSCTDRNQSRCGPSPNSDQETSLLTLKDRLRRLGQRLHEKEIEGRELLKAHLEKKAAAEAVTGSTSASSSESLENFPQFFEFPERSSVTISDADVNAQPPKAIPVGTSSANNGTVPAPATSTISSKSVPIVTPTSSKHECNKNVLNLRQKNDRATPSRSVIVDRAVPTPPKSPLPQVDTVAKAAPATPKPSSSQMEKVAKATPASPKPSALQGDKVAPHNTVSRQLPSAIISKAQEDNTPEKAAITSVPQTPMPTSGLSSAPLLPAPRSTVPHTPTVQVSPSLSHSMTVSEQLSDEPSPSSQSYATLAYQNAIHDIANLNTSSANLGQPTSKLRSVDVSQPLSAHASATSVMVPPFEGKDQLPGKQDFLFGSRKSEALDNWHPWKGDGDVNRQMWRGDTANQQMTLCDSRVQTWKDISYQQASSSTLQQGRFEGMPRRQFQQEIPANIVSCQQQGPVVEEFPHLDIINDLLDEGQNSGSMTGSPLHEYDTCGLPLPSNGNVRDSEMASINSSGRFKLTDHYYDEGYHGAYNAHNALHRLRDGQLSTLDVYSNIRMDLTASKPWLYNRPNPAVNLGVNSNLLSPQVGEYTNLANGRVNGEYLEHLYRRANGQW